MTSPSSPVITRRPVPGILRASMNISSPPEAVHASPVTTPTSGRISAGVAERGYPSTSSITSGVRVQRVARFSARARAT